MGHFPKKQAKINIWQKINNIRLKNAIGLKVAHNPRPVSTTGSLECTETEFYFTEKTWGDTFQNHSRYVQYIPEVQKNLGLDGFIWGK